MQAVRSLPPELQSLIDQYNQLLEESGYNQQYYDMDARKQFMEDYYEAGSDIDKMQGPKIFRQSGLTREEFDARNYKIRNLYDEIIGVAEDLQRQGKIKINKAADPLYNKEGDASDTFAFQLVQVPGIAQGSSYFAPAVGHSPALPLFAASGPEPLKPMKSLKISRQELPARELQESVPLDIPQVQKELIMSANPRMRGGQEPGYYIIREKGKRAFVRPVEEEERQYYRAQNRIGR
jgi:hypothetical protein|tara:strand:+ start:391 stop:1098 length:708 start_codon:yes stop_codon:yes gene_type:complete